MFTRETPEEIMAMKSNSNAIVIHINELGPSLVPRLIMECNNADYWHKFVVENVDTYERDFILKTIMDFVHPADLIPLNFVKKKRAFFLARNCLDALLKLTSNKLVVPNPRHPDMPLRLIIIANHFPAQKLKFDFEKDIQHILKKRFSHTKILNLKEFHMDEDLKDFFPLSQPKLLLYVLQFAIELQPEILDLSNNFIKLINPIRLLAGCKINYINLRDNEIAHMEDLEPLKDFTSLIGLSLDGNPLCNDWDRFSYVSKLKEMCPSLITIDSQTFKISEYTIKQKNFLCSTAGVNLVSQFLEHFFMVYDSENRQNIAPLYHKNAMFSVTYRIIPDQMSCRNIQLKHYLCIDRNMKGFHGPRHQFLFRGQKAIMNVFAGLPRSNHDPFQIQCDLIYYTEDQAILVVNGVFREDNRYIGFTRNFVLKCEDGAYTITNDQLHVYNALNHQTMSCNSFPIRLDISSNPLPFYAPQYTELQQAMHKITNLNYDYCARYLEAYHFDLKKTLESFVEMHLNDEIPPEAFVQVGQEGLYSNGAENLLRAYPPNMVKKTLSKHSAISVRAVWRTLMDDWLAAGYKVTNNYANKDALDAEAKEIKRNILMGVPSYSTPIPSGQLQGSNPGPPAADNLEPPTVFNAASTAVNCGPPTVVEIRHRKARRAKPKRMQKDQYMYINQLNKNDVSIQHTKSDPSILQNGQLLQFKQPIQMQKDSIQQHPSISIHNNLEQARLQQTESDQRSQIGTTVSIINLPNGETAVPTLSKRSLRRRKRKEAMRIKMEEMKNMQTQ